MEVECYICGELLDIEAKLVAHLGRHTELESQIAAQKARKARLAANANVPAYAEDLPPEPLKTKPRKSKKEPQKGVEEKDLTPKPESL